MAKTIPQLTDATTVNAADELIIQQGGITKRATGAELAKGLNTINGTVNVKDFGAVGDGVTDDTGAFAAAYAAAANNSVIYVPNGTYLISSAISGSSKNIVWLIHGRAAGPSAPYFNQGHIPETIRQFANNQTLSYRDGDLVTNDTIGADWALPFSLDFTMSNYGSCAVTGFSANGTAVNDAIGVSGFVVNKQPSRTVWGLYSDLQLDAAATNGWAHGLEIAAKNKGANKTSNPYNKAGGVLGIWLAGGGDPVYGGLPANPSNAGISFIENGHTWNKGIVFHDTSLTGCNGVTGEASAISFAKGHFMEWHSSASSGAVTKIVSEVSSNAAYQELRFASGFTQFRQVSGSAINTAFQVARVNNSLCGINVYPHDNEVFGPIIESIGSGTSADLDLTLQPKGNGRVRFGTHAAIVAETLSGYITIKDAAGNSRKLAVVS